MQDWAVVYLYDFSAEKLGFPHKPPGNKYPFLPSTHLWISAGGRVCWPSQPGWLPRQHFPKIFLWFTKYFSSITHDFQSCAVTTRSAWWSPQALFTPAVVCVGIGTPHAHTQLGVGVGWVVGAVCIGKRRIYKSHDYVVLPPTVRTFVFICWGLLSEVINFFFKKESCVHN